MLADRAVSDQSPERSAVDILIKHQILIHKITLICIPGPDPAVTFHTINKEDSAAELESPYCHVPDLIHQLIGRRKGRPNRNIHILVNCLYADLIFMYARYEHIAKRPADNLIFRRMQRLAVITVHRISGFCLRLAIAQCHFTESFWKFCLQNSCKLCLKYKQDSGFILTDLRWKIFFFIVYPYGRILFPCCVDLIVSHRYRIADKIICKPSPIGSDGFSLNPHRWYTGRHPCVNLKFLFSRSAHNWFPETFFYIIDAVITKAVGIHRNRLFFFQIIFSCKTYMFSAVIQMVISRPDKASLFSAEVLHHSMINFKISRIPDPM